MTTTTMRAFTGTHIAGAFLVDPTAPRAQKPRVAPFAPWSIDNSREVSAQRYRHT